MIRQPRRSVISLSEQPETSRVLPNASLFCRTLLVTATMWPQIGVLSLLR